MDRIILLFIVAVAVSSIIGIGGYISLTGLFTGFSAPEPQYEWWNASWHYRIKLNVSAGAFDRTDWVVERNMNFTDFLPSGTFDNRSVRVVEYNNSGRVRYEVPSQFDKNDTYSNTTNALGTLSFIMNGTTAASAQRAYFVYYDVAENGNKANPSYSTSLVYGTEGDEFGVNNSRMEYRLDSSRGEGSSGLIRVRGVPSQNDILPSPLSSDSRTFEYLEYSNGTHNFSFDFSAGPTLRHSGPVRKVVELYGSERVWNSSNLTGQGFMTKRYVFYEGLQWIRVETNYTNLSPASVTRNSTDFGGLLFESTRAFGSNWQSAFGNTTLPGWWFASDFFSSFHTGVIHVSQNFTSNYWVANASGQTRMGVKLNDTSVGPGAWITESAIMHFNDTTGDFTQVRGLRDRIFNQVLTTQNLPEQQYVNATTQFNASVFNRNETVLIIGNFSGENDIFNLTGKANATLDMGTASPSDDRTIVLLDDGTGGDAASGDRRFTGTFLINSTDQTGKWNVTFRSYTQGNEYLNATNGTFNVTSVLNVTVNVTNDRPVVSTQVNGSFAVRTYRQDFFVPGAAPACRVVGGADVTNVAGLGNGTYIFNFTASSQTGTYYVNCNATKDGNFGEGNDTFVVEVGKTNVTISSTPQSPTVSGVTLSASGSFAVAGNATNVGNGSAYANNISLELLPGWSANSTSEQCGDVLTSSFCVRGFNVTVPAGTSPAVYQMNITSSWRNPDDTAASNRTQVNVTVQGTPSMDVYESNVSGETGDGISSVIGNFTVRSIGNDALQNTAYSCVSGTVCSSFSLTFDPSSISSISVGSNRSVSVNVTVPIGTAPGTYNGTVNVTADLGAYDTFLVFATVPARTNVSIVTSISSYTSNAVTQTTSENFQFYGNATDLLNGSARFSNISVSVPSGWSSNSTVESCGNVTKGQYCVRGFSVTIPAGTSPAYYNVTVFANWTNPDSAVSSNSSLINVSVVSNPAINVTQTSIANNVTDGRNSSIGNFTVASVGNGDLSNVSFSCVSGAVCSNFQMSFNQTNISSLAAGANQTILLNVTVPTSYFAGLYNGTVNVTTSNDGSDSFVVFVNVTANRTWSLSPNFCQVPLEQSEGTACDVNVTNYGNTLINFTVSPASGNLTTVNATNFTLNRTSFAVFKVSYNTTGQPAAVYNTSFTVDANQSDSSPGLLTVNVSLAPFTPPTINVSSSHVLANQNTTLNFTVNSTSTSGVGISFVRVNVTRPNGTLETVGLSLAATNGNVTTWTGTYPSGSSGNTTERGNYTAQFYSEDAVGNRGNANSSFGIFINITATLATLSGTYYQGDQGTIFYVARNLSGAPLQNVTVNFTVTDPLGNISSVSQNYATNSEGSMSPLPTFAISSDSPVGSYVLTSRNSYYEPALGRYVEFQKNHSFQVQAQTVSVSGLFADLETTVSWYPNNVMKFGILVYNGEGQPVNADSMNLTVQDPAGATYKAANMSDMTNPSTGYYVYQFSMPSGTANGMYLAILEAHQSTFETLKLKAFRVTQGGPYDFRFFLAENEVPPGSDLDFSVNIENKGEVSQDVFVEYWITQLGENNTISLFSEAVLTPGLSNQTFARNIFVPTATQQGSYLLNGRMTYSTVEPAIVINKSFTVVSGIAAEDSGAASSSSGQTITQPPEPKIPTGIIISRYNGNVSLARGFTKIESVVVTNPGSVAANNVSLFLLGITPGWFEISPAVYKTIEPGNSTIFLITYDLPKGAAVGEYPGSLMATSGVISDQKRITVNVLSSIYELLKADIRQLRDDLQGLQVDSKVGQIQGKDTSAVDIVLDQVKSQIDEAEDFLNEGRHQESLDKIRGARNLMDKARDLLDRLDVKPQDFNIPWDILMYVGGAAVPIFIIFFVLWRKKRLPTGIRPWMLSLGKMAENMMQAKSQARKAESFDEKDRLLRMLETLDKERDERIISLGAYNEMRKSIEKKMAALEKK